MRSSRVTPFLLSTLLCGALIAAGIGEGRLGMADDLDSPAVLAPGQIEPEPPSRLSADLSDEIDKSGDCAQDYYYCYGYEYAAQEESGKDDVDNTDGGEEKYAYEDEYGYEYEEDCTADDEQTEAEVASATGEYDYEEDYIYNHASDDNPLAADDEGTEEESEETADQSQAGFGDDERYSFEYQGEYSHDYEDAYTSEEYVHGADEATESKIQDDVEEVQDNGFAYEYDEEYSCDYGDDCATEEYANGSDEVVRSEIEDNAEEVQEDGFSHEYESYYSRYGYEYMEEKAEPVEATEPDAEAEATEPSYDYGNWEDEYESKNQSESYDYTTEYDEYGEYVNEPETEDLQADETESDSQFEEYGSWESEYDESAESESDYDEYMYEPGTEDAQADETANDSQLEEQESWESEYDESAEWESEDDYSADADDAMETDAPAQDDLGVRGGYCDAYPDEEYAYPGQESREVAQEEPESNCDADEFGYDCHDDQAAPSQELAHDDYWTEYGYEYSYPETQYGSASAAEGESELESRQEGEPGEAASAMEECPVEDLPSGVKLFAWHPNELLFYQDQEILKTLERLCEDPSGVRRETLNDYLEELGSDAIEFAGRFEDASGIDVLGLADDLPGTAAFLGSFRLLQRGELGIDEAVDLLRHSLDNLSLEWIEGVRKITADAFDDWDAGIERSKDESSNWLEMTATARPIVVAMVSIANRSFCGAKDAITTVSSRLSDMELSTMLRELSED